MSYHWKIWRLCTLNCNIHIKLNEKISVVFHKQKNYYLHLIVLVLGKIDFKINVIPNELEKYMSFSINNKLCFINIFKFLSFSLDSLVKSLNVRMILSI